MTAPPTRALTGNCTSRHAHVMRSGDPVHRTHSCANEASSSSRGVLGAGSVGSVARQTRTDAQQSAEAHGIAQAHIPRLASEWTPSPAQSDSTNVRPTSTELVLVVQRWVEQMQRGLSFPFVQSCLVGAAGCDHRYSCLHLIELRPTHLPRTFAGARRRQQCIGWWEEDERAEKAAESRRRKSAAHDSTQLASSPSMAFSAFASTWTPACASATSASLYGLDISLQISRK